MASESISQTQDTAGSPFAGGSGNESPTQGDQETKLSLDFPGRSCKHLVFGAEQMHLLAVSRKNKTLNAES